MAKRVNYETLKQWFFEDAYIWCQRKFTEGKVKSWHGEFNEWGGALDSFDGHFDLLIEKLMLNVIFIITNGARHILSHQIVFNEIQEILLNNNLDELISILEEDEKEDFLYDLNLILNNREIEE